MRYGGQSRDSFVTHANSSPTFSKLVSPVVAENFSEQRARLSTRYEHAFKVSELSRYDDTMTHYNVTNVRKNYFVSSRRDNGPTFVKCHRDNDRWLTRIGSDSITCRCYSQVVRALRDPYVNASFACVCPEIRERRTRFDSRSRRGHRNLLRCDFLAFSSCIGNGGLSAMPARPSVT